MLYFQQPVDIGAQHSAPEREVCELAFAQDLDQAGGLELLDVMRQGCGGDAKALMQGTTWRGRGGFPDLLEDLNPPRLRERAGNARKLALGQGSIARGRHDRNLSCIRNGFSASMTRI